MKVKSLSRVRHLATPWTAAYQAPPSMGFSALISHTSKVMLKILQARLQQYVNREIPDVQAGFRKGRGNQRSNRQHLLDHGKSKRVPEKTSISVLLTMPKPLTVWDTVKKW